MGRSKAIPYRICPAARRFDLYGNHTLGGSCWHNRLIQTVIVTVNLKPVQPCHSQDDRCKFSFGQPGYAAVHISTQQRNFQIRAMMAQAGGPPYGSCAYTCTQRQLINCTIRANERISPVLSR